MRCADHAWLALAAGVLTYDLIAPPGETLSEGVDHYLQRHRRLTETILAALYLHLSNRIPDRFDPIHLGFKALKRRHVSR